MMPSANTQASATQSGIESSVYTAEQLRSPAKTGWTQYDFLIRGLERRLTISRVRLALVFDGVGLGRSL